MGKKSIVSRIADLGREEESNISFSMRPKLFGLNRFLSGYKVFTIAYIILAVLVFLLVNYALHIIYMLPSVSKAVAESVEPVPLIKPWYYAFIPCTKLFFVHIILLVLIITGYIKLAYKIRTSFKDLNVGQKGTSRWATLEEIKEQYKCIPDRGESFKGGGGPPIAREGNKLYIDTDPVNNLVIGTTRSGKGEVYVFPMIDIYSRAEKKASMVITDPKLELASASIPILKKRGYECHILNLIDPEFSMGYNPLTLIVDNYKKWMATGTQSYLDNAQLLCGAYCFSIFNPDSASPAGAGENKYFQDTGTAILSALILAMTEDCIEADRELERRRQALIKEAEDELGRKPLPMSRWPDHIPKEPSKENELKINMFSIATTFINFANIKLDESGRTMLDEFFDTRPEDNIAKLLFFSAQMAGDRQRGNVYSNMITGIKVFMTAKALAKLTAESTVDINDVGFGTKPVAVFIGLPDYNAANYALAGAFITQLYFTLAEMATHAPGGKCYREVCFILDEFGNIPPIDDMETKITVCLGRNIRFTLIVQSNTQLSAKYGENAAETIKGNCANRIFIMSGDEQTAADFSELIGKKTETVTNRTGRKLSLNKEFTEMFEEVPLIRKDELTRLSKGETIVFRTMKREDLKGNPIRPWPIKNMDEHRMKYRYEYLAGDFVTGKILYKSERILEVYKMILEIQKQEFADGVINEAEMYPEEPEILDIEAETVEHINVDKRRFSAQRYRERAAFENAKAHDVLPPATLEELFAEFEISEGEQDEIRNGISDITVMTFATNVRPKIACATEKISAARSKGDEKMAMAYEAKLTKYYKIIDLIYREFDEHHMPEVRHGEKLLLLRENIRLRGSTHGHRDNLLQNYLDDVGDEVYSYTRAVPICYTDGEAEEPLSYPDELRYSGYM